MTHPNREELAAVSELLKDSDVVHLNMLHGKIAKPTPTQIGHLYGGEQAVEVVREVIRQNPEAAAALRQSPSVEEVARVIFNHCYEASYGDTSEMMDEWAHCEDIARKVAALYGRGG